MIFRMMLFTAALVMSRPALACGQRAVEAQSGQNTTLKACATVERVLSTGDCQIDPAAEGCENMTLDTNEPRHFCEDNPEVQGCRYYQPE